MLDATPKEIKVRKAGKINPAKTCQPIGAMYAALGIHGCLPHSHGSQGCCSYHRMHLTRHFRDPIMASTSSFTEGASVFGGGANLKQSIRNVFSIYGPDVMAVHTTCLTETIGDDIPSIIKQAYEGGEIPEGKIVIHANTPSYQGSHVTGFSNMVKGMVTYLAESNGEAKKNQATILPGFVNPGDMREIKKIFKSMDVPFVMYPDTSGVVDTSITGKHEMFPKGGAKVSEIADSGNSKLTLALGKWASEDAAVALNKKCDVPYVTLKTPIGVKATDELLMTLVKEFGVSVSEELEEERGQLVDVMTDTHFHFHGKKVAISGDSDIVIGLTEFALSLGMIPLYVTTGTPGQAFEKTVKAMLEEAGVEGAWVKAEGDLFELHQRIKNEPVDLIIGTTYSKFIAKAEDIPMVRAGFPILDRSVHSYMPIVGYKGALRLVEMISGALLDHQDRIAADEDFELVM